MGYERIEDNIYVFSSEVYAQVTAGLVFTTAGTVLIDTLPFPSEAREIRRFERRRGGGGIRYVINTHHHADHIYGTYLFPEAKVIAHERCRAILAKKGEASLARAKEATPELMEVELRLPDITIDKGGAIHLGRKSLELIPLPGHSGDMIGVLLARQKILFASDAMMPVPYIVHGDIEACKESLRRIGEMNLDHLVQGHGEVLLRGEIPEAIEANLAYLDIIRVRVREGIELGLSKQEIAELDIEECGLSRVPLNGLVRHLHRANVLSVYEGLISGDISVPEAPLAAVAPRHRLDEES